MTASTLPLDAQATVDAVNTANHASGVTTTTYINTPILETSTAIINTAWELGMGIKADVDASKVDAAGAVPALGSQDISAGTVAAPSIAEPGVSIPAVASTTEIVNLFDTKYLELVALLADKFTAFRAAYFPDESTTYGAAEDWLQSAIANPTAGLPATVAAQIWEDDRSRILADNERAKADVLTTFAARRFPLPPGAAASAILQIEQKTQDELAASSRKVAVMSVEQMRFVIQNAIGLRKIAMDSAVEYIKALASGPDMATRLLNIGYDAQSKLISAAASFYNARTQAADVVSRVGQFNANLALEAASKNQAADLSLVDEKVKALVATAQSLAHLAGSLFNNLHASVGISHAEG